MESEEIHFGDLIIITVDERVLFYNVGSGAPFLAELEDFEATAFRNAVFQILPASLNPCEKGNKFGTAELTQIQVDTQFILYHPETNTVLSAKEDSKEGNGVVAIQNVDETTRFKFFGGLQDGHNSYLYKTKTTLEACKTKSYLCRGPKEDDYLYDINPETSFTRTTSDFAKVVPRRCPYLALKSIYKTSLDGNPSAVMIRKYRKYILQEDSQIVHSGDYIRVRYGNQWLSFYPNSENRNDIFFESVTDNFQQMNYSHSIFQILGGNYNGEALEAKKSYCLKHFMSSNYILKDKGSLRMSDSKAISTNQNDETVSFYFEGEVQKEVLIKEKLPLRIVYDLGSEYKYCLIPKDPSPVKNVQFEVNTLYFFGFKIPEEYTYKNLKSLRRNLAETSVEFEENSFNIVLEKVDPAEMEKILQIEAYANELQKFIDLMTAQIPEIKDSKVTILNKALSSLLESSEEFHNNFFLKGKLNPNDSTLQKYQLKVPDRYLQNLVREFRIFDLIHIINFLLIKKHTTASEFDNETFLGLYNCFCDILIASKIENVPNRFYNSQFIRIYIHFMSDECDGVFKAKIHDDLRDKMKSKTLEVLKYLLWDEDLDGLGQLNFYQTMMFSAIKNTKNFQTYYLDLVEHISSSKAYNLTNTFRDAFISTFSNEQFLSIFPVFQIKSTNDEIMVRFPGDEPQFIPLIGIQSNEEMFNYLISALRLLVSLSTSRLITYYHNVIKNYPLNVLQKCYNSTLVNISIRMLCHNLQMSSYYNYLKLPFQNIPNTIQSSTDTLRGSLKSEDEKIVEHCKSIIGSDEKLYMKESGITDEVEACISLLNIQDSSIQISLLSNFSEEDLTTLQITYCLFYINQMIDNTSINIQFLNKAKECLIKMRNKGVSDSTCFGFIPQILELFTIVNQKMKVHSTSAIYTQVIKTKNSNAEEYARKIITGLKKIHTESFAPFEMIGLNEPLISGIAMKYLSNVARYEESIAEELQKFVILSSQKEIDQVRDIIDITLKINEKVRKFNIQKEKQNKISCDDFDFVSLIENLEKLLAIIYNPTEHYFYPDDDLPESIDKSLDPKSRFFKNLREEKAPFRDKPFRINPKAIAKVYQRVFPLLNVHEVLLQLLNNTVVLTVEDKESSSPPEIYLPRIVLIILIAFTYKNRSNQDLLANSHGFISLYYQQKYIDKSCDTLTLFGEVMRDNDTLLEINKKFIYDITCYTFLGTIKPRAINKDAGAYLATAIIAMHFLYQANIPKVTYDNYAVIETKFANIFSEDFSKINDLIKIIKEKTGQEQILIELGAQYYNIREILISSYKIIKKAYKQKKFEEVENFRKYFKSKIILDSITSPTFRTQFELKNYFLRFIKKIMFSRQCPCPAFFVTDQESAKEFIGYLVNELCEFLLLRVQDNKSEVSTIKKSITDLDSKCINRQETDYEELRKLDLNKARLQIYLNDLPINIIYERMYIFSECWKLSGKIAILYPQFFLNSGIFDSFLTASELLISQTNVNNFSVLKKMKNYFDKFTDIGIYEPFWMKIKSIKEKLCQKYETLGQEKELNEHKKEKLDHEESTELKILKAIVESMKATKEKNEQTNIETFYDAIKSSPKKTEIWSEFLTVLSLNPANLHKNIYNFIAKFLEFSFKKDIIHQGNISEGFYYNISELQTEFSNLNAEYRLIEGLQVVQNTQNLFQLVDLILSFSEGYNVKIIQKLSNSITKALNQQLPMNKSICEGRLILNALLKDLFTKYSGSEAASSFSYISKSYQINLSNPEEVTVTDEWKANFDSHFKKFLEYTTGDVNQLITENGPLPLGILTLPMLFRITSNSLHVEKLCKEQIIKSIKTYDFSSFLHAYYKDFVHHNDLEKINKIRNELLIALDIWVTKIKGIIVSFDDQLSQNVKSV